MKTRTFLFILFASAFSFSCGGNNQEQKAQKSESVLSGTLTVQCDNTIMKMLNLIKTKYDSTFPEAHVTFAPMSAREAMKSLFAGNSRCVVVARDYLYDEDSIMKAVGIKPHFRYKLAEDALVFFTKKDFPLDTLSDASLKALMANDKKAFSDFYPSVKQKVDFATLNENSSLYGNLCLHFSKNNHIPRSLKLLQSFDSLKTFVNSTPNSIGIGYLSQLENEPDLKMLKISWKDSTGKYMPPKIVHQSYLTMGAYPYKTFIYAYLFEQDNRLPKGFASYYGTDPVAQKLFLYSGIVPAYAKIVINTPE